MPIKKVPVAKISKGKGPKVTPKLGSTYGIVAKGKKR